MLISSLLEVAVAFICLGASTAQKVVQAETEVSVLEKEAVTMDCVYETLDPIYSLFWYKQPPSGEIIFLIRQDSHSQHNATDGRYSLSFQKAASSIKLIIAASQLGDSAVYFCALRETTVRGALKEPYRNLSKRRGS